ncbi:hypothetical protein B0T25DRAFT_2873 [Lasiosphaeria hispida]|uniref:RING-type domain-containing protein n=1 Tax=Lasiosphaeria hispida TaxID=260671 RepID=A0AAJ0HTE9_9PEZI|nr:hypothetical protein B0T25DRAFT_2873 [Lasiosphaeria hispida]
MCIKLIRHFACSAEVEHTVNYIIRCSTPLQDPRTFGQAGGQQPCLVGLDEEEEWYREPCVKCSGECDVPTTAACRTERHETAEPIPEIYGSFGDTMDFRERHNTPASLYAKQLVRFYLLFLSMRFLPFRKYGMGWQDNGRLHESAWLSSMGVALREMHCRSAVTHRAAFINTTGEPGDADEYSPVVCDCLLGHRPHFSNPALDFRTCIAEDIVAWLIEPDNTGRLTFSLGEKVSLDFLQRAVLENIRAIPTRDGSLAPSDAPFIELIAPMTKEEYQRRSANLRMVFKTLGDTIPGPVKSQPGFKAIMGLVKTVWPLLALDRGLSLGRAARAFRWFAAGLLAQIQRPDWGRYRPYIGETDGVPEEECAMAEHARLAYLACHSNPMTAIPRLSSIVRGWAERFLRSPVREGHPFAKWVERDRRRAKRVLDNIVLATTEERRRLEATEATCLICLEKFSDHEGHRGAYPAPVQNRRCSEAGANHWFSQACIVKYARTLQFDIWRPFHAVPPHCPVCRRPFCDEDGSDPEAPGGHSMSSANSEDSNIFQDPALHDDWALWA